MKVMNLISLVAIAALVMTAVTRPAHGDSDIPVVTSFAERPAAIAPASARDADGVGFTFHADAREAAAAALEDVNVDYNAERPLGKALRLAALADNKRG